MSMTNKPVLFSFLVTIYNDERYLRECLESIAKQTFSDFEVWMIDDGSTDSSSFIAQEYSKKDSRFHYFFQKNAGTSCATNTGLSLCKGKYIVNLDHDDYIDASLLANAKVIIDDNEPDIIQYQCEFVDEGGFSISKQSFYNERHVFIGHENLKKCEMMMPGAFNRTHSRKIILREKTNGIGFQGVSKGADTSFLRRLLFRCEKVVLCPERLYFIRELPNSESRKNEMDDFYKQWLNRELSDILFCVNEQTKYKREKPFWVFNDFLDMWEMFATKAYKSAFFDSAFFSSMGNSYWRLRSYIAPRGVRSMIKTYLWLKHTRAMARRLSAHFCAEGFTV